jgi:hypothetical protein
MEHRFGVGWMRFDNSKGGLLAADWARLKGDVLYLHVTSCRPTWAKVMAPKNPPWKMIEPGRLVMAARSI